LTNSSSAPTVPLAVSTENADSTAVTSEIFKSFELTRGASQFFF
jgi:hypothetical protein